MSGGGAVAVRGPRAVAALALVQLAFAAGPASGAIDARLQGVFAMRGRLTVAHHVRGEHRGQEVRRRWTFTPQCPVGVCQAVTLVRQRSGRLILDTLVLRRTAPGRYVGHGRFWVALRCAGHVQPHGGYAVERITVAITQAQVVGGVPYATAVRARYVNRRRVNLTACPGGIGHDAAAYTGELASALP